MTAITYDQAAANIREFYAKYLPTYIKLYPAGLDDAVSILKSGSGSDRTLESNYKFAIAQGIATAATFENAFNGAKPTGLDPDKFANSLSADQAISFLYPNANAANKAALTGALQNGTLNVTDMATAISIVKAGSNPTVDQIKTAPDQLKPGAALTDSGLHFDGLTHGQLDFLTSMYIGGFSRAPEYEGLKYWAGELANDLQHGMTQMQAYVSVGHNIYQAAAQNGESGTTLGTTDYVNFAYTNALGRTPDTAGLNYWLADLNAGRITRGDFLTTFLTAGMDTNRDATYLSSRTAVGEFAAQQHVSGKGAPGIDAKTILNSVTDLASAQAAINAIIQQYGTAGATKADLVDVFNGLSSQEVSGLIELTGVQGHEAHVLA